MGLWRLEEKGNKSGCLLEMIVLFIFFDIWALFHRGTDTSSPERSLRSPSLFAASTKRTRNLSRLRRWLAVDLPVQLRTIEVPSIKSVSLDFSDGAGGGPVRGSLRLERVNGRGREGVACA